MADLLVRVRLSGRAQAVAAVAERLRPVLRIAAESADDLNRRDPGVRRYLDVLIAAEDPDQEASGG